MTRPLEDWADLKYEPGTHLSHIVPFGAPWSLCGEYATWHGTGCWDEIERAKQIERCAPCMDHLSDLTPTTKEK